MSKLRSRIFTYARWSALPIGLTISAALLWQASNAAFTAGTTNPTNNWATGSVTISDDDSNGAMFTATGLSAASATGEKCIVVEYDGDLTSDVKLFATTASATNELDDWIDITVEQGESAPASGGSFAGGCAGFVAETAVAGVTSFSGTLEQFATAHTNIGNGFGDWDPSAANQTRVFRFTYDINNSIPNSAQGSTAALGFTWQATS